MDLRTFRVGKDAGYSPALAASLTLAEQQQSGSGSANGRPLHSVCTAAHPCCPHTHRTSHRVLDPAEAQWSNLVALLTLYPTNLG